MTMRKVLIILAFTSLGLFVPAASSESCSASEGCSLDEADDASFLQTNVHAGRRSLLTVIQETQAKKTEFFRKIVKGTPTVSSKAAAAHDKFREEFLANYPRGYDKEDPAAVAEYLARLENFATFLDVIEERNAHEAQHNTHPNPAFHGITKYADWTQEEFNALLGSVKRTSGAGLLQSLTNASRNEKSGKQSNRHTVAPCTVEWTSRTTMRNQGNCGSCWTFATATTLRASYIQQHGVDPGKLSTQFLVDCINIETCSDGVNGCCGGNPYAAYKYIMEHGGIPTQADYGDVFTPTSLLEVDARTNATGGPISNTHGLTFSGNHPKTPYPCKAGIKNSVTLTALPEKVESETDIANYVCNTGVVGIVVDASKWNSYKGGVLTASSCAADTDHAVTLVGMSASENAYIVQNQWGKDWGVALDGTPPPASKWSNCPELAQGDGCHDPYNAWIATDCALECSGKVVDGGYVFLKFGENTCGITDQALTPLQTATATGVTQGLGTTTTTTTAYDAWMVGYKAGYDDGKDGKATTTTQAPPSDQDYAWGYTAGYQDGQAGNPYLGR